MAAIALIDNDFVHALEDIKRDQIEKEAIIRKAFEAKEIDVRMHEMVYNFEYNITGKAGILFEHGVISILDWTSMFGDDQGKSTYYCSLVPELYKRMTGECLEIEESNILKQWISGISLGEVHCVAACYVCGYGIFLSDDHGSKKLKDIIGIHYNKSITVYNREELIQSLEQGILNKEERRAFTHNKNKRRV